jgi:hypothetical protein
MHERQSVFSGKFIWPLLLILVTAGFWGSSCKKQEMLSSGGSIHFSTDTLSFDTVFTSLGSAILGVKIFNDQDQVIKLSSVRLGGGDTSFFHLNVDGFSGFGKDIEIPGRDSIYVFATVKIDPTNENNPFIVEDKLVATLNGQDFSIPVIAYGQNAHYIRDSILSPHQVWGTDKPYVIMGGALVDEGDSLTISPGCRIYMHQNARLFVAGRLHAVGTKMDSIVFQGDRLDRAYFGYEGYPGEWGGIYFSSYSTGSKMVHVTLKNGGNSAQGAAPALIQLAPDSVADAVPQLTLEKCTIENSIGYGILAFNGSMQATNCLIDACGASTVALVQGGNYHFDNCTIATYGSNKISHNDNPSVILLNFFFYSQTQYYSGDLNAVLRNCTIQGSLDNELLATTQSGATAAVALDHCLIKGESSKIETWVQQNSVRYSLSDGTLDPMFTDVTKYNYRPKSGSPLIDQGLPIGVTDDRVDFTRNAPPDIGCYEFQP